MNMELAYRCQMMPQNVRNSRMLAVAILLRHGWSEQVVKEEIDAALRWANTHCMIQQQEKARRTRARNKTIQKGDDALDTMFSSMGADPKDIPVRKDLVAKTRGGAAGHMAAQQETVMGLGLNYSGGGGSGDIVPYVKFDARAGRFFRNDRTESNGAYSNNPVDITSTFKAVMDLENIEVGYMKFGAGAAPEYLLVKLGTPMPHKPADIGFKQGARIMMKLAAGCGGDIREITGNAAAFLKGIDDLHTAYEAGKAANPGKLPIVILQSTLPIKSGQGQKTSTNYQPVFEIQGWAPRPADLVFAPKGGTTQAAPATSAPTGSAPSTGSTQVSAPAAKQAEMADADGFG